MAILEEIVGNDPKMQERVRKAEEAYRKRGNGQTPPEEDPGKSEGGGEQTQKLPEFILLRDMDISREVFWLIDETLPRGTMIMVYGRGGSGKTYLGTSLAIGLTSGQWHGREAEKGAVLYCAFERPQDAEDRLTSLRERLELGDLPIALLKLPGYCLDETIAAHIVEQAKKLKALTNLPVHIVIDTVSAALAGGKEDDEGLGMLRTAGERMAADTGATVFWLHHEGKADHNGPRGHLVLAEACMVWWRVEEREDGSRVVHVDKANRGPSYVPLFAFRLVPFIAGQDVRGRDIQLCELQLVDLDGAMASKPKARFKSETNGTGTGGGKLQRIMAKELIRLARKYPAGVERGLLYSAFVLEVSTAERAAGKGQSDKNTLNRKFRQTLAGMIKADRVEDLGDESYLPTGDQS